MTSTKQFSISAGIVAFIAIVSAFLFASAAFAETNGASMTGSMHAPMMKHASSTPVNAMCMQTAVDARETAIAGAVDTAQSATKASLVTRKAAFHDAWGMSDTVARGKALKAAWSTWSTDQKSMQSTLKASRKATWDAFKNTVRTTCKGVVPQAESVAKESN